MMVALPLGTLLPPSEFFAAQRRSSLYLITPASLFAFAFYFYIPRWTMGTHPLHCAGVYLPHPCTPFHRPFRCGVLLPPALHSISLLFVLALLCTQTPCLACTATLLRSPACSAHSTLISEEHRAILLLTIVNNTHCPSPCFSATLSLPRSLCHALFAPPSPPCSTWMPSPTSALCSCCLIFLLSIRQQRASFVS